MAARSVRIAFLAIDAPWVDPQSDFSSFSYAARKLEASVRGAPDLADVETHVLDLRTDEPEAFFEAIKKISPTLVAGSTYIWSVRTFLEVARRVKEWDASIRVVLGGPAARASVLSLPPYRPFLRYVDAFVTGEGEEIIRALARDVDGAALTSIPGLTVPHPLGLRTTGPAERPSLDLYPSPYQIGTAPRSRTGFIETFRGCPISCAFCQWGDERSDRVYGKDYLASHLRGLVEANATNVFFTDAAFNLTPRAFRNLMAAENEVGALERFEVNGHFYPNHLKDEHLEFLDRVGKAQVSIGVQSFDTDVLRKLGRPFDLVRFERVLRELRGRIPIDVELIFGLPGDNFESFRRTFERTIELADTVRVFFALVLPDALLERAEEFQIRFDAETFMLEECNGWSAKSLRDGWEQLVRATEGFDNRFVAPTWFGFATPSAVEIAPRRGGHSGPDLGAERLKSLTTQLGERASGWSVAGAHREKDGLLLRLDAPTGAVVLEVIRSHDGSRAFARREGLSYSYRGSLDQEVVRDLGRVIDAIHPATAELLAAIIDD